ncbi:MAG TPA: cytochrome c oxidase assembly protein [Methylomirabilota bacterium]|nr:cytochrome c oxidase assembly protein [Methylomirabilota bacterium]
MIAVSSFHWHSEVALGLEMLVVGYLLAMGPLRRRRRWGPPPSRGRVAAFLAGTAVLAGALLGPLAEWAEHVALSAHMVQHLLLILVVPALWLLGLPAWLLTPIARAPFVGRLGRWMTRPLPALALASAVQVAWHVPAAFDTALRVEQVHALEHISLLGTGLLLWWPVAGSAPEWPRPSPPAQLLYLFLATIPMMAIAAPITLAEGVLYPFYADAGGSWPLAPRTDQELAGILMWVGGMFGYLVAGTVVFFRWAGPESREDDEGHLARTEATAHGA